MDEAKKLLPDIVYCADAYETMEGADALVLLTEWNAFRALDLSRVENLLTAPVVIDLRNIYNPQEMAGGRSVLYQHRPPARIMPNRNCGHLPDKRMPTAPASFHERSRQ